MKKDHREIEGRMRSLLAEISAEYDFGRFTIDDFIGWLEKRRGRKMVCIPYRIDHPDIYGAWLADDSTDYILYECDTLPIHQVHIRLHECAHMLCGHAAQMTLTDHGLRTLFRGASVDLEACTLLRSSDQSQSSESVELEAETLASLIKRQVLEKASLQALTQVSSNEIWKTYIEALRLE